MKKTLIIISAFIISLTLVACTDTKSKQQEQKTPDNHVEKINSEEKLWDEYSKEISRIADEFNPQYTAISSYENISSKSDLNEKLIKLKATSESISENISKIQKETSNEKVKKSIESTNSMLKNTIAAVDEFLSSVESEDIEKMNASIDKYVDAVKPILTHEYNNLIMEAKNDVFKSNEEVPAVEEYDTQGFKDEMKANYLKLMNSTETSSETNNNSTIEKSTSYKIKHGEMLDATINGDILVIKAKISPSYKNSATINQNGFNIEDIIKNQGASKFNEIQYWAVADMKDGSESKVISFTLDSNLIKNIEAGNIPGNQIVKNAKDVWILPSLQN